MSKWNTSYIPSTEDVVSPDPPSPMRLLAFGPLQAGAAVLVALLILQPPFVMNKEDGYETISMVRMVVWILISMLAVWAGPKVLNML